MIVELTKKGSTDKLSYKEAGQALIRKLNLGNIQISSYNNFVKNIIKRHMNRVYKEDGFELSFDSWWIDDQSKTLPISECKANHKSYEVSLMALVKIKFTDKFTVKNSALPENTITLQVEVTRFPRLTQNGNFIINGVDKILISHLEKADKMVISPPNPKNKSQFGQLEIKSRLGNSLVMDDKITFKLARMIPGIPQRTLSYNYEFALQKLGYKEDALSAVMGMNSHLAEFEGQSSSVAASIHTVMNNFLLDASERHSLNRKTSFEKNLTGKVLAEDITINGVVYKRGSQLNAEQANMAQEEGILSVKIIDKGIESPILNNGFVDAGNLFGKYGLEVPDDFRLVARNPIDQDEEVPYYLKCNKQFFDELYKRYGQDKDQLQYQIRLNMDKLVGTCIVKDDIVSMMSLFSRCTMGLAPFDDIDNLENKKVVNIADIFEQGLIDAIGSGKPATSPSLVGKIKKAKQTASINTAAESGAVLLLRLELNKLDCGEKTITKETSGISLFNIEDSTNPLAQVNHKRKITLTQVDGRGGIKATSGNVESRSVNPSYAGRIDCIETPESQVVGLVREIGALAYLNEFGQLEAPFFKVDHEKKEIDTTKVYYMEYGEEVAYRRVLSPKIAEDTCVEISYFKGSDNVKNEFFALPSVDNVDLNSFKRIAKYKQRKEGYTSFKIEVHKKNWFVEDILTIQEGHGGTITGSPDDVDFVSCCGGEHIFSPVTSAIPFIEFDDAARGMMGAVMSKQAIPVWGLQKQIIKTPMAQMIAPIATGVIVAPYDLEVLSVDALGIRVRSLGNDKEEFLPCLRNEKTSKTTINQSVPFVKVGDICLKGDVMADNSSTKDGELAHGTNLMIAIAPLYGFNYEDGVIISSRLVKEDILTSIHIEEVEVKVGEDQKTTKEDLKGASSGSERVDVSSNKYSDNAIIKTGVEVNPGDILAVKMITKEVKKENKVTKERVPLTTKYTESVPGTVVSVETYEEGTDTIYTIKVAHRLKMGVGDKYTGRHGNKGITCCVLPEEDMPYLADGTRMDMVINPLGIPSRMNIGQLFDGQGGLLLHKIGFRATVCTLANFNSNAFKHALKLGNCDKQQLYDGRTGKAFMFTTTVVMPYVEKLEHVVSHKLHARASKPYTRKQQPTQGKAQNGGQRLGEMEFWMTTAHGAQAVQRELTMFRSDDVANRKAYVEAKTLGTSVDMVALQNRKQNVAYSFQLSDVYYKSCFKRLAYYDANGNEIDISKDASSKDRSMERTLADVANKRHNSDVTLSERLGISDTGFQDYEDDDLDEELGDFGDFGDLFDVDDNFDPTGENSPTEVRHTLNLQQMSVFEEEDEEDFEEDNEQVIIMEDTNEDDLTGDEIYSDGGLEEIDPF